MAICEYCSLNKFLEFWEQGPIYSTLFIVSIAMTTLSVILFSA